MPKRRVKQVYVTDEWLHYFTQSDGMRDSRDQGLWGIPMLIPLGKIVQQSIDDVLSCFYAIFAAWYKVVLVKSFDLSQMLSFEDLRPHYTA